ncbi:MAG TPA: sigma-54 dependent transcriptional regulator [Longimicrobiales bacterium]
MKDTVLVSTHDLPRAGRLRKAFEAEGYAVDLVTPDEDLAGVGEAVLLILSADAGTEASASLVRQARDSLGVPVLGYGPEEGPSLSVDKAIHPLDEIFASSISPEDAALLGHRAVQQRRLQHATGITGETYAMREVLERVIQIAPVGSTVLVTGESGTGKELVARGIHALSPRRHKPFIAVNVAALADTLLESELFGHEKGAFTGAIDSRKGMFELAHGGTIFLDEIGEMPVTTQTKLLRVLEQREFHRVGGEKSIRVDVRIIAATNQDLRQLVDLREFRRDLYFRLNVLRIELPPLRERRDDIPLLVDTFIEEMEGRHDRTFPGLSGEARAILQRHSWPGNVRELKNLVESMVVLAPGREIGPSDIPPEVRLGRTGTALVPIEPPLHPARAEDAPGLRPQLEFIFRTLVDLRMDVDDLRKEFERYQRGEDDARPGREVPMGVLGRHPVDPVSEVRDLTRAPDAGDPDAGEDEAAATQEVESQPDERVVIYRPGMTMEDIERSAIATALEAVRGNRRKAADTLGIGERTLYRKLKKYELDG